MTTTQDAIASDERTADKLPLAALLALFTAGFLGILNETVPAGLLPQLAAGLGVSESAAGQTITVYALATAITAIGLSAALRTVNRRTLLASALVTFAVGNGVIALTDNLTAVFAARVVSGIGAGLVWANIGNYAARLVPGARQGRAISIAMAGIPAALTLGLPAGTLLGDTAGWQITFGAMALAAVALIGWVLAVVPGLPGVPDRAATKDASGARVSFAQIVRRPGVRVILVVAGVYNIAHNLLYTYIGPLAERAGVGQLAWVLLTFGVAAIGSIWATGAFVDPHHRLLVTASTVVVGTAAFVLAFAYVNPVLLYAGVAMWGAGFGGSATLFVTAGMRAAGHDAFQAMLVTVYNIAIAAGGLFGGLLLSGLGVRSIPWVAFALLVPTVIVTFAATRHAFPRWQGPRSTEARDL